MKKIIFVFVLMFTPIFLQNIFACSCGALPPIYDFYENSSAVFVGKVTGSKDVEVKEADEEENNGKVEFLDNQRVFSFEAAEVFKGVKGKKIEVNVGSINNSCYRGFTQGESYLIYANGEDEKNLNHGFCSLSGSLPYAQNQIFFIREFLKGKSESQIYGTVTRGDTFPNTTKERTTNLSAIKIILEGKEKKFETITDKNGVFNFNKIPDGDYLLKPEIPSIYRIYPEDEKIKISEGRVYSDKGLGFDYGYKSMFAEFSAGWNNAINGIVFDAEGKPVKLAAVRLLPVSSPFGKINSNNILDSNEDGKYSCSGETPGKYYLVAEIFSPSAINERIRIFYPQAETPEKATPINLKATDNLNFDILLPPKFVIKEIKGKIVWSDGQPASRSEVSLQKSVVFEKKDESEEITDHGFDWEFTDEQGNFVLRAFENTDYWIHYENEFEAEDDEEETEIKVKGKPIKIKVGKTNEPLVLTLEKP